MRSEAIVTIPPEVVRTRASSTVFVKASSLVNLDFAGIVVQLEQLILQRRYATAFASGLEHASR
jgi:hypothetical protein